MKSLKGRLIAIVFLLTQGLLISCIEADRESAFSNPYCLDDCESSNPLVSGDSPLTVTAQSEPHRLDDCIYHGPAADDQQPVALSAEDKNQLIEYLTCILPEGSYSGLTEGGRDCSFSLKPAESRPEDFIIRLEVARDPPRMGGVINYLINPTTRLELAMLEESRRRVSFQFRRSERFMGVTNFDISIEIDDKGRVESIYLFNQSGMNHQLSRGLCLLQSYEGEGENPLAAAQ